MRDEVFKEPIKKQFEFDESVVSVFDDMVSRSVPFYDTVQSLITEILVKNLPTNANVFDLGCSTATTLLRLFKLRNDLVLNGVDSSEAMIKTAKNKALAYGANLNLFAKDILEYDFSGADAVILNYTLQFIRPIKRDEFVKKIYSNLNQNGLFVFSEKLVFEDKKFTLDMIEIYEEYKAKQGYSKFEIAQKRQALENILIPYTQKENEELCLNAGFKRVETLFKWANFATFIAFK
ncbi:carboxy-S-adenosyl-L-methionine synthase CmoA [Campylobacter hyointestinalis]|uniref:carboxy-S-adenosyl-L-methionine synthase CmoA n=1 Tax=Campylobacter hyointestinalis TaxID=198 RepID=UPI000DCE8140|nr:carboxy-S-adenosyl-L-methionine synthase CmoA [Campylobacter hyointestinalis]RAZ23709.1 carboxy-S-adenosyl-L-methionine synthase CmoA [Campylobacter hyointestinalis subsp. lawsonii]RAZ38109.1 carboxy-S-adenosyl-L-methionine synthase CmoA [Campylobacter hyointestinalis subsp. lawsonii]RAZ46205.1 carboxy-S-adenosyl-L-methionine synthase CmoA [Campylobacter hyointestinalis subsp. lawsonii]RAZ60207.1 carboxy-S-adenosyl-L-methionine synthase CmoA [Campylobacter hyointestinalis subsp. lawsonii]